MAGIRARIPGLGRGKVARDLDAPAPAKRRVLRIIGPDRRVLLTHAERISRMGGRENLLAAWREYAEDFIRSRPLLDPEVRTWLMQRGFDKDASWLYGLPVPDEGAESYLSDLQVRLMPLANQETAALLASRMLFSQVFRSQLPWGTPLGLSTAGRLAADEAGVAAWQDMSAGRRLCLQPTYTSKGRVSVLDVGTLAEAKDHIADDHDIHLLGLPPESGWLGAGTRPRGHRFKLLLLRDGKSREFSLAAACLVTGNPHGLFHDDSASIQLDPGSGRPLSVAHRLHRQLVRDPLQSPWGAAAFPSTPVPGWSAMVDRVLSALSAFPLLEWLQLELDLSTNGFAVVDAGDRLDCHAFQVHSPLMEDPACRKFIKRFCL